jgi:predicted O-methyltransferase YrrM
MESILNAPEKIWEYDIETYNRLTQEDFHCSLMPSAERRFINGMIRYFKPHRILELGVCEGGGSIVILNAISDMSETKLISIDIDEQARVNMTRLKQSPVVGHAAASKYPNNKQWDLYIGKEPSEILDTLDTKFDLVIIDTLHIHPGETLNFLTILPYLLDSSIVIIQDISLFSIFVGLHNYPFYPLSNFPKACLASRLLWDVLVGEKITIPVAAYEEEKSQWDIVYSNIGAIQINSDTRRYIDSLFSLLEFPWGVVPTKISAIAQYLESHYPLNQFKKFQYAFHKNTRFVYNKTVLYHYSKSDIDFARYDKVIFYGCGQCLKDYFFNNTNIPVIPNEIWDNNADAINNGDVAFLECIPVCKPKMDVTDKDNIAVVISLYDGSLKEEVKSLLQANGFTSVFDYSDCY